MDADATSGSAQGSLLRRGVTGSDKAACFVMELARCAERMARRVAHT